MKSSGFPSKKKIIRDNITPRTIPQYRNFIFAIVWIRFALLYEMKWRITNAIINAIGTLCVNMISRAPSSWRSIITNFCIEYNMCSVSWTLNGIHARNTKYCVISIEIIFPNLLLKNGLLASVGNAFCSILCMAR